MDNFPSSIPFKLIKMETVDSYYGPRTQYHFVRSLFGDSKQIFKVTSDDTSFNRLEVNDKVKIKSTIKGYDDDGNVIAGGKGTAIIKILDNPAKEKNRVTDLKERKWHATVKQVESAEKTNKLRWKSWDGKKLTKKQQEKLDKLDALSRKRARKKFKENIQKY